MNKALIAIEVSISNGVDEIRDVINFIEKVSDVISISSVYKQLPKLRTATLNMKLYCVVKIETELGVSEFIDHLVTGDKKNSSTYLLTYNELVLLNPMNSLPNPILLQSDIILHCAAECWGQYKHPALGQTLNEIVLSKQLNKVAMEFFYQGRQLI